MSAMTFAACDKKGPAGPSPITPGSPAATFALTGTVRADGGALVQGARVEVTSAPNAGRSTSSDASGRYVLSNLQSGSIALQVSALGHGMRTMTVSLSGDQVVDVSLPPAANLPSVGGRVIDALTQMGLGGVSVTGDGISCSSDANGQFSLASAQGAFPKPVSFTRAGFLERQTWLNDAGQPTVSLIPGSLNQHAFDEMLRSPVLRRWREAPRLVIDTRVVQYADLNASAANAIAEVMSDADFNSVRGDLEWALGRLTAGAFNGFRSVTRQDSPADGSVSLLNPGQITVVRMAGLTQATGYWGYGRYMSHADGTVVAGLVVLDRDFERTATQYRRSLRAHELGHALGYAHVSGIASVMDPSGRVEPTTFDLDAFRIAFQRQPGNRAPDIDPDPSMAPASVTHGAAWTPAIR